MSHTGSSGRGLDSGAGSGSGGDGEAEVGTLRTSARRLKGKRQRSNLGQPQIKVSCPFMHCTSHHFFCGLSADQVCLDLSLAFR